MAPPPRTLVLFDIDWTLLNFAADREVLRDVIATFTDDAVLHALDPTGRSDVWVVAQLAEAAGEPPEAVMLRYAESYHARLDAALALHGAQPLPGARALLDHLAATEGVTLGIATGNLRANAALKLRAADLLRSAVRRVRRGWARPRRCRRRGARRSGARRGRTLRPRRRH